MFKFHLALFLILFVNFGVIALWCWQCDRFDHYYCTKKTFNYGWKKIECTGSCVFEPATTNGKPNGSEWNRSYCSPEKMRSNCNQGVIFLCCCKFETTTLFV